MAVPNTFVGHTPAVASEVNDNNDYLDGRIDDEATARTAAIAAAVVPVEVVTALPGGPEDGQECFLLVDDAAGAVWHLKYREDSASAYKWEFLGGAPLMDVVDTLDVAITTNVFTALATAGPAVTLPAGVGGDFIVDVRAQISSNAAGVAVMSFKINAGAALSADGVTLATGAGDAGMVLGGSRRKLAVPAGATFTTMYKGTGTAVQSTFWFRSLAVRPVRVG